MKTPELFERLQTRSIDLVLCSSDARWNAAVRVAILRACDLWPQCFIRLHEVEDFAQLRRVLHDTACAVVGLEVGAENLRVCLDWITETRRPRVPVVGLLSIPPLSIDVYSVEQQQARSETLESLVREAGAVWTLDSPLDALELLQIAARHGRTSAQTTCNASQLSSAIWQTLPWQSTRPALRLTGEA